MADGFEVTTNAALVAANIAGWDAIVAARAAAITRHYGQILVTTIQRRASLPRTGPPGPRLQTGDLVRSINLRMEVTPATVVARAGTNRPQARRLEYGFTGTDSLGRRYHQPPYSFFRPALFEVAPQFTAAMAAGAIR